MGIVVRRGIALALALVVFTACSGPSGVDVSHDWSGIDGFLLMKVDGLVTVTGIDSVRGRARPMIVIPSRSDDDDVLAPQIARSSDGTALITRPRTSSTGVLYRIGIGDPSAERVGTVADGSRIYPWAGGWVEVAPRGSGSLVRVLDARLHEIRSVTVPIALDQVATDGADHVCLASGGTTPRGSSVDLVSATVSRSTAVTAGGILGCVSGRPVVVIARDASGTRPMPAAGSVHLVRGPTAEVQLPVGRIDGVVASGDDLYAVVGIGSKLVALDIDLGAGTVGTAIDLTGLVAADDLYIAAQSLVVADGDNATILDLATDHVTRVSLPGQVFPN
ncbi:MAG TPA: hypothetical protein VFE15_13335 [Marmoricola sp.]|jgi:hypothetical protein|nr:hypothetical protein [Marmoricola sp.]